MATDGVENRRELRDSEVKKHRGLTSWVHISIWAMSFRQHGKTTLQNYSRGAFIRFCKGEGVKYLVF